MIHDFHPCQDIHFSLFYCQFPAPRQSQKPGRLPITMFLRNWIVCLGSAGVPPACCGAIDFPTRRRDASAPKRCRTVSGDKIPFAIGFLRQLRLWRMADRLPIYEIERDIIARLKTDRRLILSAPTGSGKSTQVPADAAQARTARRRAGCDSPAAPAGYAIARGARGAGTRRPAWQRSRLPNPLRKCHLAADENSICNGRCFAPAND